MSDQSAHFVTGKFIDPALLVEHFHIREGDSVADFGAGRGFFTSYLAGAVGEEGKIYALEIQKNLVEAIGEQVRMNNQENVDVLWCDIEASGGSKLADDLLDVAVLVNTFFQIEDKAGLAAELKRTLRPGGKLFVVDWTDSFNGMGPMPHHVVPESDARAHFETHGFTFERTYEAGSHHYGLAFRLP